MVTLTPSRIVGRRPFRKSAASQARGVVVESDVPKMETQVPGAIALPAPAALITPPAKMVGFCNGAWTVNVTRMVRELPGSPVTARVSTPLYTPTPRSLAVTATVSDCGVRAADGVTVSHLPFGGADTVAWKILFAPATVILRNWTGGSRAPATFVNGSDDGAACSWMLSVIT